MPPPNGASWRAGLLRSRKDHPETVSSLARRHGSAPPSDLCRRTRRTAPPEGAPQRPSGLCEAVRSLRTHLSVDTIKSALTLPANHANNAGSMGPVASRSCGFRPAWPSSRRPIPENPVLEPGFSASVVPPSRRDRPETVSEAARCAAGRRAEPLDQSLGSLDGRKPCLNVPQPRQRPLVLGLGVRLLRLPKFPR